MEKRVKTIDVFWEVYDRLVDLSRQQEIRATFKWLAHPLGISQTYLKMILVGERAGYSYRPRIEGTLRPQAGNFVEGQECYGPAA